MVHLHFFLNVSRIIYLRQVDFNGVVTVEAVLPTGVDIFELVLLLNKQHFSSGSPIGVAYRNSSEFLKVQLQCYFWKLNYVHASNLGRNKTAS